MVKIRDKIIGNGEITIQTMLKNQVQNLDQTFKKIDQLYIEGCDFLRISLPDFESIDYLQKIIKYSPIPIVSDIHFDYRLAIKALEIGVDKIRINPGNIGNKDNVKKVVDALKIYKKPVRIGINKGSLPAHIISKTKNPVEAMLESAKEEIGYFEELGYYDIILSFKSSNVIETINVNRIAKNMFGYPLHIGVTEAGDDFDGVIKNSIGIGTLINDGIGDTIRVSLTASEIDEIRVAKKILESLGKRESDFEIISCPTCGRTEVDIQKLVKDVKMTIQNRKFKKKLKIAIMGCVVNGPGEAKDCDFGIAGGKNKTIFFKNGEKIKIVDNKNVLFEIKNILEEYYDD